MIEREFENGAVSYDRESNAVYVSLAVNNAVIRATVQLVDNVNIDLNLDGNIVGVEVLL